MTDAKNKDMQLIKIDGRTVRENPDYMPGHWQKHIPGEVSGWIEKIKDGVREDVPVNGPPKEQVEALIKEGYTIGNVRLNREMIDVTTLSDPTHFFEYTNPKVRCEECGGMVRRKDIEIIEGYYSSEEFEQCPICGEHESFKYEYEGLHACLDRLDRKQIKKQ